MPLSPGHKLGPYEILALIGEGGMGEVYRARDARLDRIVAIKLSKSGFSERFEREARAVAALNHPHICQLYDVGPNFLVMEYVEGSELRGPLPVDKAIAYAVQILDALAAAHRKRITHRDLKPANIIVTSHGIKLLDFGLAKLDAPLHASDATLVAAPTTQGTIVGTLQYMSPEQLQSKSVDGRSDIFSFGCVLYELLTGRRAFEGESTASVIAAILEREPQPANLASPLERILKTCLAKDPEHRFQDALDLKRDLLWATEQLTPISTASPKRFPAWAAVAITAMAAAIVYLLMFPRKQETVPPRLTRLTRDGVSFAPALSPDGKLLAFVSARGGGNSDIYVQQPNSTVPLRITDDPAIDTWPTFSPDGSKILFTSFREPQGVYEVSALGGEVRLVLPNAARAIPSPSGKHILYARGGILFVDTIPSSNPVEITKYAERGYIWSPDGSEFIAGDQDYFRSAPDGKQHHPIGLVANLRRRNMSVVSATLPVRWLPNGELLFTGSSGDAVNLWRIPIREADTATPVPVTIGTSFNTVDASATANQLVFTDNSGYGALWSLPCDLNTGKVTGDLRRLSADKSDGNHPSILSDGSLVVYASRKNGTQSIFLRDLRTNKERLIGAPTQPGDSLAHTRLSPDGKRVAASYSLLQKGTVSTGWKLVTIPASGGEITTIYPEGARIRGWTPDGKFLLLWSSTPPLHSYVLDMESKKRSDLFPFAPKDQFSQPSLSPDGKWLAFVGPPNNHLYVAPFHGAQPVPQSEWLPIAESVNFPTWSPDGTQLYYSSSANTTTMANESVLTLMRRSLDPASKRPNAAAVPFYTFSGGVFGNPIVNPIAVARDQIILVLSMRDTDIWAMDLP
jgi:serine/threonine protein kinase